MPAQAAPRTRTPKTKAADERAETPPTEPGAQDGPTDRELLQRAPMFVRADAIPEGAVVLPPPSGWYADNGFVRIMSPEEYTARQAALVAPFPADWIEKKPQQVVRDRDGERQPRFQCKADHQDAARASADGHYCGGYHARSVHLDYIGHAGITERLVQVDPLWEWVACETDDAGAPRFNTLRFPIRLTVLGMTRLGIGDAVGKTAGPGANKEMIGDALRNAAMRFGVGTYLWAKSDRAHTLRTATDTFDVDEAEPILPDPEKVQAELERAAASADPLSAVMTVANTYGRDALDAVTYTRADGRTVTLSELTLALLARIRADQASAAAEGSQEAPGEEPAAAASTAETQPVAPEPVAEPAASAAPEAAAGDQGARLITARLTQEVTGQAEVLGLQVHKYVEPFLSGRGKTSLAEVSTMVLRAWVVGQRPRVIEALEAAGRATAAQAYRAAGSEVRPWQDLIGDQIGAPEREAARV